MKENLNDWSEIRKGYLLVAIICFCIGTYLFARVYNNSYEIKPIHLIKFKNLVISEKPTFFETSGKRGRKWIEFRCHKVNTTFEIASFDYWCVNDDEILNEINVGDSILIKILKEDIENFNENTTCEIHSLIKNKKEYLDIECRNQADNRDSEKFYIILFVTMIMTAFVYSFTKKPKFFDEVNPQIPIWIVIVLLFYLLHQNII